MPVVKVGNKVNGEKVILSLCDYSGQWLRGYQEQGYSTIQFDLKHGDDVTNFDQTRQDIIGICGVIDELVDGLAYVHGILAAPPCTDFSVSGAQYWPAKDADGRTAKAVQIVEACLYIIDSFRPRFWALENPVGRLPKLVTRIGKPWYFQPHEYALYADDPEADRYTKRTGIWGTAVKPAPKGLEPIRVCKQGSWIQKLGGKSERTKELRSMTPVGFARAFAEANP